jgi:hypothetical protein
LPYTIKKQDCKASDGSSGSWTLSYTDKKGVRHRACHKTRKGAGGQISAIEAEGVGGIDEGLSWVPPTVLILESIEDELARLAGGHQTGHPKFEVGDRVVPSKIDAAMRTHARGTPKGTVVRRGRSAGRPVYDVQWDPLPSVRSNNSWMSDDDEHEDLEDGTLIEPAVPQSRLRRSSL